MPDLILVNRLTGQPASEAEQQAGIERAKEIMRNPYASPEQMAWAMQFPEAIDELVFREAHKNWGTRP
jgi:hypothetical protein